MTFIKNNLNKNNDIGDSKKSVQNHNPDIRTQTYPPAQMHQSMPGLGHPY